MNFEIPKKGESLVCQECKSETFKACTKPCSALISYTLYQLKFEAMKEMVNNHGWRGDSSG